MSLAVRKGFLRLNVIYRLDRTSNIFVDDNVGAKNHNANIPLILDKNNVMIVMQKLKFMQEYTFAINLECLHNSLQVKLLIHNCTRKTCKNIFFVAYNNLESSVEWKISSYVAHL